MRVTMQDVAARSGVSRQAVSFILNDKPGFSFKPQTRARVLEAARALGYRPNASATAMRTGRFGCVAFLQDSNPWRSDFRRELVGPMQRALHDAGQNMIYASLAADPGAEGQTLPRILTHLMVDGLLLNYHGSPSKELSELVAGSRIPAVWINTKRKHDAVHPDDQDGGVRLTQHLIEHGHHRITFVDLFMNLAGAAKPHYSRRDRYVGYRRAMKRAKLTPTLFALDRWVEKPSELTPLFRQWLSRKNRPTAIVTNIGRSANASLVLACAQMGLQLPGDLSLAGFAGTELDHGLAVTTMVVPWHEMGTQAVKMLTGKLKGEDSSRRSVTVEMALQQGQSVARARRGVI